MSDELIVLDLLKDDGTLEQEQLPLRETELNVRFFSMFRRRLTRCSLAALSSTARQRARRDRAADARDRAVGAPLTVHASLLFDALCAQLNHNALAEVLASVLAMTQLTLLAVSRRSRRARQLTRRRAAEQQPLVGASASDRPTESAQEPRREPPPSASSGLTASPARQQPNRRPSSRDRSAAGAPGPLGGRQRVDVAAGGAGPAALARNRVCETASRLQPRRR